MKNKGFTLIELLVVISIIGVLSTIVLSSLSSARESARVSRVLAEMKALETASALYNLDTGEYASCSGCTISNDPFLNNNGVEGWNGPYTPYLYNGVHPWGGQFRLVYSDWDGGFHQYIVLDDDAPGELDSTNGGAINTDTLILLDQKLDDGNLSTGDFIGDGVSPTAATGGEAIYRLDF